MPPAAVRLGPQKTPGGSISTATQQAAPVRTRYTRPSASAKPVPAWRAKLMTVFVGNVVKHVDFRDLAVVMDRVAPVIDWFASSRRWKDGRPAFGFMRFKTKEAANKIIERFHGWSWHGRQLRVIKEE